MVAEERATRRWVGPVTAAAVVRLAWLGVVLARGGAGALWRADTASYLEPGRNLLLHGWFATGGVAEVVRTPGYAVLLAAAMGAGGALAAALAQVGLSVLAVVLAGRLTEKTFGKGRAAAGAMWMAALEPLGVIYSILLLPETVFVVLLLLSLEWVMEFMRGRLLRALAVGGLWLAAAAFVRPVGYYLPLVLAAGLAAALHRDRGLRWKAPAVLLLCSMPWLVMWQGRNRVETGFGGFSAIATENLYFYTAAGVRSQIEGRPLAAVQDELGYPGDRRFLERHPEMAGWGAGQRLEWMRGQAWDVLRAHPWLAARLYVEGAMRTALNPGGAVVMRLMDAPVDEAALERERAEGAARAGWWLMGREPGAAAVMLGLALVQAGLYGLAVRGVVRGGGAPWCVGLLAGVGLYFIVAAGGAAGIARLRTPAMPLVCVLAGAGVRRRAGEDDRQGG